MLRQTLASARSQGYSERPPSDVVILVDATRLQSPQMLVPYQSLWHQSAGHSLEVVVVVMVVAVMVVAVMVVVVGGG